MIFENIKKQFKINEAFWFLFIPIGVWTLAEIIQAIVYIFVDNSSEYLSVSAILSFLLTITLSLVFITFCYVYYFNFAIQYSFTRKNYTVSSVIYYLIYNLTALFICYIESYISVFIYKTFYSSYTLDIDVATAANWITDNKFTFLILTVLSAVGLSILQYIIAALILKFKKVTLIVLSATYFIGIVVFPIITKTEFYTKYLPYVSKIFSFLGNLHFIFYIIIGIGLIIALLWYSTKVFLTESYFS